MGQLQILKINQNIYTKYKILNSIDSSLSMSMSIIHKMEKNLYFINI